MGWVFVVIGCEKLSAVSHRLSPIPGGSRTTKTNRERDIRSKQERKYYGMLSGWLKCVSRPFKAGSHMDHTLTNDTHNNYLFFARSSTIFPDILIPILIKTLNFCDAMHAVEWLQRNDTSYGRNGDFIKCRISCAVAIMKLHKIHRKIWQILMSFCCNFFSLRILH